LLWSEPHLWRREVPQGMKVKWMDKCVPCHQECKVEANHQHDQRWEDEGWEERNPVGVASDDKNLDDCRERDARNGAELGSHGPC